MTAFDSALALVLQEEGGRVDDRRDPGGRTNEGVTQRTFDAWRKAHGEPLTDVYTISSAEVAAIYRNAYADPIRFDDLPAGVAYAVFDDAVNSGVHEGVLELQRALGVAADGQIGVLTLSAAAKADPSALIGKLCDGRLTFLRRLKAFVTFGRGWSARVAFVRSHALEMAKAAPVAAVAKSATPVPASCSHPGCPLALAKAA